MSRCCPPVRRASSCSSHSIRLQRSRSSSKSEGQVCIMLQCAYPTCTPQSGGSKAPAYASSERLGAGPVDTSMCSSIPRVLVAYYGNLFRIEGESLGRIGIIGGSGLYSMPGFHQEKEA